MEEGQGLYGLFYHDIVDQKCSAAILDEDVPTLLYDSSDKDVVQIYITQSE